MRLLTTRALLTVMLTLLPSFVFAGHIIDDSKNAGYLFVLSASSGSLEGDTLTLNGVPNALYFSDRPAKKAGHMTLTSFVEMWDKGTDSFKSDPPNAILSILNKDRVQNLEVELNSVEVKEDSISINVKVLTGSMTEPFGPASLFIDPPQECAMCSVP